MTINKNVWMQRKYKTDEIFKIAPIPLTCPCGEPLSISQTVDGRWVLGHWQKCCCPLIHGDNLGKVMDKFVEIYPQEFTQFKFKNQKEEE